MNFNPEMLILAREANGLSQAELASFLKVAQGTISKMESGLLKPTEGLIQELAYLLGFSPQFFCQSDRVYGFNSTVFFHRKKQSATDRMLRKLHARMNVLRMRVRRLLQSASVETPFRFQALDVDEYQGRVEAIAQLVRSTWLIPVGPVRSIVRIIEDAGGVVYSMDFGTKKVDAISEWIPGYPPVIILNSSADVPPSRLRFNLPHELGHLIMHQGFNLQRDPEEDAHRFAAEFMMPRKQIKPSLYNLNIAKLLDLKQEWKVSMAALVYHAHRLGTITDSQYKYLNLNLRKRWGINEPMEEAMPEEKPAVLSELIEAHRNELGYNTEQLSDLLFFAKQSDFERDFLDISGNLRLVKVG